MGKVTGFIAGLIMGLCIVSAPGFALDVPALRGHINDYGGMLRPETARALEQRLAEIERTDSTQIAVLTIPSLEGEVLEEYSIRVAEKWKIGQEKRDNGVILLVARDDRKLRIEVGRGLEGKLTDLVSGRIIRNEMVPFFRAGDYSRGIEEGVDAIIAVVKGEYIAGERSQREVHTRGERPYIFIFVILFFAVVFLANISKVLGGIGGAIGLPLAVFILFSGVSLAVLGILSVVGLIAGLLVGAMPRGMTGYGGGFYGGGFGGGSGGGFSGGGFSGGGGSFGGGGSSGSW